MSITGRKSWENGNDVRRGLYRDRENGWIFGVCAGLADRFDYDALIVRIVAVVALLIFTLPTALAYLGATVLIRQRPLIYRGMSPEHEFWRGRARSDHWSSS